MTKQCRLVLAVLGGSLLAAPDRSTAAPGDTPPGGPPGHDPPPGDVLPAATSGQPPSSEPRDDDGAVRLSLPTEEDRAAWLHSGFRLALGALYGQLRGSGRIPDFTLRGVVIRPGIRIDPQWSIYVPLQYAVTSRSGARFAAAVEPTWHITPSIAIGLGVGYAGLLGLETYDPGMFLAGPESDLSTLGQSYTLPDAAKPLSRCTGVGLTALARAEAGYVLGRRSRTHIALELLGQWTGCEESAFGRDSFTGTEYVLRQWWAHAGMSLSWGIEWR